MKSGEQGIATTVSEILRRVGYDVSFEKYLPTPSGEEKRVDIIACQGDQKLAIEIKGGPVVSPLEVGDFTSVARWFGSHGGTVVMITPEKPGDELVRYAKNNAIELLTVQSFRERYGEIPPKAGSLKISRRQVGDVVVLDLKGKIILGTERDVLRDYVFRLLHSNRKKIVLNLDKVSTIDSPGVGTLAAVCAEATVRGKGLKISNAGRKIRQPLELTRLTQVLDIYENESLALQSFQQVAPR